MSEINETLARAIERSIVKLEAKPGDTVLLRDSGDYVFTPESMVETAKLLQAGLPDGVNLLICAPGNVKILKPGEPLPPTNDLERENQRLLAAVDNVLKMQVGLIEVQRSDGRVKVTCAWARGIKGEGATLKEALENLGMAHEESMEQLRALIEEIDLVKDEALR